MNKNPPEEISFGEWLRQRRRLLDLTQQALADEVGCARITLRRIESGGRKPSKELAQILLSKLGVPEIEHPRWILFARGLSGFPSKPSHSFTLKPLTNLPAPLTTFIGREKEQAEITRLIAKHRLVTLIGPGGIGKTSLSSQIGKKLLSDYPNGVWMVMLDSLTDPVLVPQSVAFVFDIRDMSESPILERLTFALRTKSALLILDNCEHLLDSCAQLITTLLTNCPALKILATSREALGVAGEALYHVPSLALPDEQQLLEKFREYESIRLFEERAQLVQMHFALTLENASSVAQICHSLDGIPLAIELAAAHANMLSTEQIAARLKENINVLTSGGRIPLPRHQTLRASMDWSWNLLSDAERILLQRLSVFAGGWTLEAAEVVCNAEEIEPDLILKVLSDLANQSLVVVEHSAEETRYDLLETVRQYASEKSFEAGGSENIRDKHLAYFVKLAEQAEHELYRANQLFWLNKLDDEIDNLRMALEWALITNVRAGLRLTTMLEQFWRARGYLHELEDWLWQLLERHDTKDSLHVRAMTIYCTITADLTYARTVAEQSLQLARILSDKQAQALSLMALGVVISNQGKLKEGIPLVEQSLTLHQALGNKFGQAYATGWLGNNNNDLKRSKTYIMESLRLYRELGYLWGIAVCLGELAEKTIWEGDCSSPTQWLEEARTIYRQLGAPWAEARVLHNYGELTFSQGDYSQACMYYEEAIRVDEKVGNSSNAVWSRVRLSYALLRQGDILKAKDTFHLCTQQFQRVNNLIGLVYAIEGLASLHLKQPDRAARLFAWADATRESIGDIRPRVEQIDVNRDIATCLLEMGEVAFADAYDEGQKMTLDEAVSYALKED
jgi:predicted ATPase/DNA-binding XRE family transcriptional regulator